jgi:predicted kinase
MLFVFGGLPGTGKTTLARSLAEALQAVYLRIDTIEQALRDVKLAGRDVGEAGYVIAYRLAEENLGLGATVVADCVNPIALTRNAWRDVAANAESRIVEVEVICSDTVEHRRRVEARTTDIDGLILPTWQEIVSGDYEPWDRERLVIDTAKLAPEAALKELLAAISD